MRLLLAAGLLAAIAGPAAAQRVNTNIDDVRPTADGFSCRSAAYPSLMLIEGADERKPVASISYAAKESTDYNDLRLNILLQPGDAIYTEGKKIGGAVTGFRLRTTDFPDAPVAEALLSLDGKPDAAKFTISRKYRPPTFDLTVDDGEALALRLMRAETAELVLVDATRKPLGRYSWYVGGFRYAVEMPLLWRWKCNPSWD